MNKFIKKNEWRNINECFLNKQYNNINIKKNKNKNNKKKILIFLII